MKNIKTILSVLLMLNVLNPTTIYAEEAEASEEDIITEIEQPNEEQNSGETGNIDEIKEEETEIIEEETEPEVIYEEAESEVIEKDISDSNEEVNSVTTEEQSDVIEETEEVTEETTTQELEAYTYTITYNANGGYFWDGSSTYTDYIEAGQQAANYYIERDGYVLAGWYSNKACSAKNAIMTDDNPYYYPKSNMTLYAKWEKAYTITYVFNGGSFHWDTENSLSTYNDNIKVGDKTYLYDETDLTKWGYVLEGWYFDRNLTRKAGKKPDKYSYTEYTPTSNVTLYAKWIPAYRITLTSGKGNFGDYFGSDHNYEYDIWVAKGQSLGTNRYMRYVEPTLNGKMFVGWYSNSSLSNSNYVGKINYEYYDYDKEEEDYEYHELYNYYPKADMTLYPKFADAWFIELDANGGLFEDYYPAEESITLMCEKGKPFYPAYNYPIREGYAFQYWSETADGSTGKFRIFSHVPTSHETFYAIWREAKFTDVRDTQLSYFEPVYWAVDKGITTGTSETTFSPNKPCTRAQFVTFLWRALGKPEPTIEVNPFDDVKEGLSYTKAVLWAYENGITTGTSETTFSPGNACTRAQVATFLWRANGSPEPTVKTNPFDDIRVGLSYSKAVLWAYEKGITTGTSKTTFSPFKNCTRAQTVTFLYRTYADK